MKLGKLSSTNKLCVFFICTENEIINEDLESTLCKYLNKTPSVKYKIDIYLYVNKVIENNKISRIRKRIKSNPLVNKIEVYSLDLPESIDVFWYPWGCMPKPRAMPELGYTSGANTLFYESIEDMMNKKECYENFLMLEADSQPLVENWFDILIEYCQKNSFEIAGSTYKGRQQIHKQSRFKEHLNGVALYRNNSKLKNILKGSREVIKNELPQTGYLNFDIANYIFYKRNELKYEYKKMDHIINMSDPKDSIITEKEVLEENPKGVILHKKKNEKEQEIDFKIFKKTNLKDIPVCMLSEHCGSEYIKSVNIEILKLLSKKDFQYSKPVCFRITTSSNSHIYINSICEEKITTYPKSFFKNIGKNIQDINYINFAKIFENRHVYPISILIDSRYCSKLDLSLWDQFKALIHLVERSPYIFCFWKDLIDLASSQFAKYEINNFHAYLEEPYRSSFFNDFMEKRFESNSFFKAFFEQNVNSIDDEKINKLLSHFNIFDINLIDEVLASIYKQTYNSNIESINFNEINHNPTINKIIKSENDLEDETGMIYEKHSLYKNIYNRTVIKTIVES